MHVIYSTTFSLFNNALLAIEKYYGNQNKKALKANQKYNKSNMKGE